MILLLACSLLLPGETRSPDTVVVVPPAFQDVLRPWLDYRRNQGHEIALMTDCGSAAEIRAGIRRLAGEGGLRSVVLVGDVTDDQFGTPTHFAPAKVNVQWGSESEIATDNWFADLDDDRLPDLAVGRLSASSPGELATIVRKILAYEQLGGEGDWQRRLNFVAGVGGFGPVVDSVLETATKKFLTEGIPAEYSISMTYASWRSPYCPDPRRFHDTVVNRFNEGCLFWVYIGHGQRTFLDRIRVPGATYRILDTDDVPKLQSGERSPIAIFLSCYAGAFDEQRVCLAEEMLRSGAGPVAVFAGSRVTMPYAMAVMGSELMEEYFGTRRPTLGELCMHAKRQMAAEAGGEGNRQLLDALAKVISPTPDQLRDERLEHVLLFNLLGDPLLRLRHGDAIRVETQTDVRAGQPLNVRWVSPVAGRCHVELVCRRDRTRERVPTRTHFLRTEQELATYTSTYAEANDRCWVSKLVSSPAGPVEMTLTVPAEARGPCHVRVLVEGAERCALGAADVFVRRPPRSEEAPEPVGASPQN